MWLSENTAGLSLFKPFSTTVILWNISETVKRRKKKKKVCGSKRSLHALEHLSCFGFKRELSHRLTPFRNARIANLAIYYWCLILMWLMWETMARCHSVGWWEYEWAKTKIQNNVKKNDIWKVRLRHKEYFLFPAVSFLLHSLLYTVCIILPAGVHHKKKKKKSYLALLMERWSYYPRL